jgi:flagellar biogenesis protein FliO
VRTSRRSLAVEQTLVVGKGTVALVSVDGERVLVGVTQGCISFHAIKGNARTASLDTREMSERR